MLSLKDIKSDYFYIDCVDNATLRECVKLLPFKEDYINEISGGVDDYDKAIVICDSETYLTAYEPNYTNSKIYKYTDIDELKHLSKTN